MVTKRRTKREKFLFLPFDREAEVGGETEEKMVTKRGAGQIKRGKEGLDHFLLVLHPVHPVILQVPLVVRQAVLDQDQEGGQDPVENLGQDQGSETEKRILKRNWGQPKRNHQPL